MSQSDEKSLIQFINDIPPGVNAYSTVANQLFSLLQPPTTPAWVQWVQRVILLGYGIMFLQAVYLVSLRIKTKMFRGIIFNELAIFWFYGKAENEYNHVQKLTLNVIKTLQDASLSYSPESYDEGKLLIMLIPERKAESHLNMVNKYIRMAIQVNLYQSVLPSRKIDGRKLNSETGEAIMLKSIGEKTRRKRDLIVMHATIAYTSTLVYLPVIIWQSTFKGDDFLRNPTWLIGTRLSAILIIKNARLELPNPRAQTQKITSPTLELRDVFGRCEVRTNTETISIPEPRLQPNTGGNILEKAAIAIMPLRIPNGGIRTMRTALHTKSQWSPTRMLSPRPFVRSTSESSNASPSSSNSDRKVLASLDGGPVNKISQPIAPNSKAEAKVAFYTMGRIIRAMIFTTLGLGTSAVVAFAGLHLWVENFELPPGNRGLRALKEEEELYGWKEELEGWGAAYAGGGTDSRIGWKARSLVRAAWVAANWQTGQRALSQTGTDVADEDGWMVDSAFAIAETRLQQALLLARKRGLKLDQDGVVDRALMELESRLAYICECINTPLALTKAHQVYERLWQACAGAIDRLGKDGKDCWEIREGMRIATRLGDVGLKLSTSGLILDPLSIVDSQRSAEQYLVWSVTQGLGLAVGDGEAFRKIPTANDQSVFAKPGGIFSFLTKSKQPIIDRDSTTASASQPLKAEVALLEASLDALNQLPPEKILGGPYISPTASRATILALTRFIVHLATVDVNLAYRLQKRTHGVLQKAIPGNLNNNSPDAFLHGNWFQTREALAAVYLAELGYATKHLKPESVVDLCQSALRSLDSVLSKERFQDEVFKRGGTRSASGRLAEQAHRIREEARMTAAMASNILGIMFENCPVNVTKESPAWCGSQPGCSSAKAFFTRALRYSDASTTSDGLGGENRMVSLWNQSRHHLDRVERNIPSTASDPISSKSSSSLSP
ncbi:hypothetical protein CROQUDRAFT_89560 [Cronartium quercuum f. sp. fusiforme G11]|uniref:Uncharacterized protein n=1 Tax=Cronartium quercuum f. sp. fusiforme G11 TaxID=708437 RepID=A0A9P6TEL8_9BASI|nr:hypothetical protein CROQUDRAFT_89560 [Cronartium quercuum f. sp. fusiforme G11]